MRQLKLNEGERVQIIAALCAVICIAKDKERNGSLMRLSRKILASLVDKGGKE